MSKCVLKIALDHPNRTYAAGEKVAGTVEVNATDDCACRKLTLIRL